MGEGGKRGEGGASRPALADFRETFYGCLTKWADALFELADAALCAPAAVGSVPSLNLEPVIRLTKCYVFAIRLDTLRAGGSRTLPPGHPEGLCTFCDHLCALFVLTHNLPEPLGRSLTCGNE